MYGEKACWQLHKNNVSNTEQVLEVAPPQISSCTATYHPSRKLSELDEPDMWDTARQIGTNSWVTYSCGPLHKNEQRQDDQVEPTYNNSVPIWDVTLRTCRKQWTIEKGGERGSGISVLMAQHVMMMKAVWFHNLCNKDFKCNKKKKISIKNILNLIII